MKKKKWTAVIASAAIAGSLLTAMPVSALYQITVELPSGYEQFDDKGTLDWVTKDGYYPAYRKIDKHSNIVVLSDYRCNVLDLAIPPEKIAAYRELETKYEDFFDSFDQLHENTLNDVLYVKLWDSLDEDGNLIKDPTKVESKQGIVRKMCQTLREAEVIESAEYYPYYAQLLQGSYDGVMLIQNVPQTEQEQLLATLQQLGYEDAKISWSNASSLYYANASAFRDGTGVFADTEEIFAAAEAVEANYEGAIAKPSAIFLGDASTNGASAVDMMTQPLISYGDPDNDGNVSVEDAVAVLTYYAQQSAGLEAKLTQAADTEETAFLAADVDGDGQITVEDAVAILTYYAQKSAGLDAAW